MEVITCRISDNEPFPRDAEVPVKSRTSSINWKARPCKHSRLVELMNLI
jgi:hypothetical protein